MAGLNPDMVYGLVTGLLFGFLLQRGRVIRYDKQLGALRVQDFTILKFMLSSIVVSMIGVYILLDMGMVKLSVKADDSGRRRGRRPSLRRRLGAAGLLSRHLGGGGRRGGVSTRSGGSRAALSARRSTPRLSL